VQVDKQKKGSPEPIPGRCGAKISRTNPTRYCTRHPVKGNTLQEGGNGRCKYHGGTTPRGIAHPSFKTGDRSKYFPAAVRRQALESYNDPELLSLRAYVALSDARWKQLAERFESGESGILWSKLRKKWAEFQEANNSVREARQKLQEEQERPIEVQSESRILRLQDRIAAGQREAQESLAAIGRLISEGAREEEQWHEILNLQQDNARLQAAEIQRQQAANMTMTVEDAMMLAVAMLNAVKKHVSDQKQLGAISQEFSLILDRQPAAAKSPDQPPRQASPAAGSPRSQ
jgi:hypothetical protein